MATKTVLRVLAVALALGAGCGADGGHTGDGLAPDVAAGLAARAEQVANALDTGQCDQALSGARSLQNDLAALPAEPAVRAEALAGAARLVSGISCPVVTTAPPATAVTVPEGRTDGDGRKGKGHKGDDDDD